MFGDKVSINPSTIIKNIKIDQAPKKNISTIDYSRVNLKAIDIPIIIKDIIDSRGYVSLDLSSSKLDDEKLILIL